MDSEIEELKEMITTILISHKVPEESREKIFKHCYQFIHFHKKAWRVNGLKSFAGLVEKMRNAQIAKGTESVRKIESQVDRSVKMIKKLNG